MREIFDAIFYLLKTGCQWRQLPGDFPAWQSVYYYFRKWSRDGTFKKIHDYLRGLLRRRAGRDTSPSVGIIDSQSVRGTYRGRERGIDGGKKVKGRKRHIITDTQGLVLAVRVHPANHHDSKAARGGMRQLKPEFKRMKKIYADGDYRDELKDIVKVVPYWFSTSNHNARVSPLSSLNVVPYWFSTSNHNCNCIFPLIFLLFLIGFLHQITTGGQFRRSPGVLFLIGFLHQITTVSKYSVLINPLFLIGFLHQITTIVLSQPLETELFLIGFLHQITTATASFL